MKRRSFLTRTVFAITLVSTALFTVGLSQVSASAPSRGASPEAPQMLVVKFHADWCGSCKAMGPVYEDMTNKFDKDSALFVKLDFTNASTSKQAEYNAAALGLNSAWEQYGNTTGFILLIDANSKKILDKLGPADNWKEMQARFKAALAKTQ